MCCDTKCKRVRKGWNRRRERKRQRGRQGLNGWEHTLCWAAIVLASASMLIPKGQTASLMDTETIDLYSITGTHGIRLPGSHTQMCRYSHTVNKNTRKTHSFPLHTVFIHVSSPTHLSREKKRVCTLWSWTHMQRISKAIKHFLVAGRLHLDAVCT